MKKVIVIVGPTATGKSHLGIELAKVLNTDIINGDSVQVYKTLNIGSAKVKPSEMKGIKHHLLDIREPGQPYSVYHFQQDARQFIQTIDIPIIVGGTGLYIKAALYDYVFDHEARDKTFEAAYKDVSTEDIAEALKRLDPKMDIKELNRRRLLRAFQMAKSGSLRSKKQGKDTPLYDHLVLYLDIDRDLLEQRLIARLSHMFDEGLMDEVKKLHEQHMMINAIGYRELNQYMNGEHSLDEAKQLIVRHSRRLAKKQKTWFLNQMDAVVLDATDPKLKEKALLHVKDFLKGE